MNKGIGKVLSVNISEKKGTVKKAVEKIIVSEDGIQTDAHSGKWHRQVSLLDKHSIENFEKELGRKIEFGEFAENITTEGFILYEMNIFDILKINKVKLEVTQIGKECHGDGCAIYNAVGKCVMPKQGIFTRVISGGSIKPGDKIEYLPKLFKVLVITLSDRAFNGEYKDRSGPEISNMISRFFNEKGYKNEIINKVIPDDSLMLKEIIDFTSSDYDLIFTTGGTGIGKRDITIETIRPLLDKEIPGIMEMIRIKYGTEKPNALLSRSIAGVMNDTLIYALPGSVKAVNEYMHEILKTLMHTIYMLKSIDAH